MKYTKACWNCHELVQDVTLFRDFHDEHYMALACQKCGAYPTLKYDEPKVAKMDYKKTCWNCHESVQGNKKDVKLFKDYYDEHYMALVCQKCGAHATLTHDEEPKGWYWDYTKKCLVMPE